MERHWKAQTPVLIKARRHYFLNFLFLESLRLFLDESIRQSVFSDRRLKVLLWQEAIVEESTLSDFPVTAGSARPLGKHSWNDRCWFYGEKIKRHMHIQCLANNIEIVPAALCRNIRWSRFITAWKWRIKYNKKPKQHKQQKCNQYANVFNKCKCKSTLHTCGSPFCPFQSRK